MDAWDTIIVGAGSAGCVLAHRLSADPSHRVLLLEAGGTDRRFWVRVPIGYARTFRDPAVNWMLQTEPEPALGGRSSYWPRGRLLGGSGSINAMAYVRGQPADFDGWAQQGNPGWSWHDVLPFFLAAEDNAAGASALHGAGGPMRVTDIADLVHPLCDSFFAAASALGLGRTNDLNGAQGEGVGIYPIHTRGGLRESTATAYLRPVRHRPNLTVHTHAQATRLLLQGRRATGVAYLQDGTLREAQARCAVVLCAGAIHSPQLLQLSGIGDAGHLQALGIPPVLHAPAVGEGLQDHLHITHVYRARVPTLNDALHPWHAKLRAGLRYLLRRTGPLSMSVNQAGGFVRWGAPGADRPHIQLYFNPASYTTQPAEGRRMMNTDPFPGFSLSAHACRPTSRGRIRITRPDPRVAPAITPNYLATAYDQTQALLCARLLRALAAAEPLRGLIAEELLPGGQAADDAALMADFRARADTIFHPVGTCAMGPDPQCSVVDARLRVHGVDGLRVIDASVFPAIPSGNTQAPVVMVAEKGARMLLEDAAQAAAASTSTRQS
ncbi:MAG: GMC family oxidoreductase N-terminal domain-containing protein [Rhodoferax sp.]|nr:GMC family oxidoreductase N-terminal domain-containing protein [Rhodoferax sp.]